MARKKPSSQRSALSSQRAKVRYPETPERIYSGSPLDGITLREDALVPSRLAYQDATRGIWVYQGDCLEVLDQIVAKHPDGCFDMIFADPPYFLSNGGITCHAGKMVKVDKGDWDKSRGPELNHEFNTEWLRRCQRVLKPNGTIWVTGTHHVIFSVGFALQQLGFKILNDIAWEKPNPPPNLSCRYFTHSTETVIWAARNEKSRHVFNYAAMKAVTGKQMKTVWRKEEFKPQMDTDAAQMKENIRENPCESVATIWTLPAPGRDEKTFGKHPTQKPVALVERCLLAATNAGDLVLDPFMGAGTTAVACVRTYRLFVGIELDYRHVELAGKRADRQIIEIWLREFRVRVDVVVGRVPSRGESEAPCRVTRPTRNDPNNLDPKAGSMDRIGSMADVPEIQAESIFHETKFVFLSCAQARTGSVVHTTVDADVQSAWTHTPQSVKLATTHIVRCETEILRIKAS